MPITEKQAERRKAYLGSSDTPRLVAAPYDLWLRKTGRVPDFEPSEPMECGKMIEDALLDWAAEKLNIRIRKNQHRVAENGIHAASFDALGVDPDDDIALEAKTTGLFGPPPNADQWGDEGTDQVPDTVLLQTCHQFYVLPRLKAIWVPALIGGKGRRLYRIDRNESLARTIGEQGAAWWERHVVADSAPDATPADDTYLAQRTRDPAHPPANVPDALIERFYAAEAARDGVNKEYDEAKAAIIAALGEAETGATPDGRSITYLEYTTRRLREKELKADLPQIAAKYQGESKYRRMYVKEPKRTRN